MSHLICFSSAENTFPRRLSAELFSRTCRQPGEEEHEGLGSSPGSAQPGSPCRAHPTEARLRARHSSSHLLREMPPLRSPCGNGAVLHQRLGYASTTPPLLLRLLKPTLSLGHTLRQLAPWAAEDQLEFHFTKAAAPQAYAPGNNGGL